MGTWAEIFGAVVSGGATGLLGTAISRVFAFYEDRQKFKHDLELLKIQGQLAAEEAKNRREEIALEAQYKIKQIETQGAITLEESANETLGKSYTEAATRWSTGDSKWIIMVDVVRGLTRPALTIMLCVMAFVLWSRTDNKDLETQIVMTILYMATAAVLWWFGTRPNGKFGKTG